MMAIFKIFHELFFDGISTGESILCKDFYTQKNAEKYAASILDGTVGYLTIRKYKHFPAIIGGKNDNGEIVNVMHNCLAAKVSFVVDNQGLAETEVEEALKQTDFPIVMLDCIDSERQCKNAFGKQLTEEEFDNLDPESDDAWFDDYNFSFAVILGCEDNKENRKTLEEALDGAGISIVEE